MSKFALIQDNKIFVFDDRWVTIRGNHVLIKGNQEAEDIQTYVNSVDPEELTLIDQKGNTQTIKRGKPMSFKEADSKNANPNYDKEWGYDENCQVCVAAFELRLRGYDIEAKRFDLGNDAFRELEKYPNAMFDSQQTIYPIEESFIPWTLKSQFKWISRRIKTGERYHMELHWKDKNYGHVVTIQKVERRLMVYDPQSGEVYKGARQIRDNLMKSIDDVALYRVDDKPFNVKFASKVFKKARA